MSHMSRVVIGLAVQWTFILFAAAAINLLTEDWRWWALMFGSGVGGFYLGLGIILLLP